MRAGNILATAPLEKPKTIVKTTVAAVPDDGSHRARIIILERKDTMRKTVKRPKRSARKVGIVRPNVEAALRIATRYLAKWSGTPRA